MGDKEKTGPDDQALKKLAEDLIEAQSTMTLATAKGDVAWSAPVYYVFFKSCFYWAGRQKDAYEGVESFLEKRSPKFTLRVSSDMPDFYPWWKEPKV